MAEEVHTFRLRSRWTGDSDGNGSSQGEGWSLEYGRPAALGGKPGRANPEELLLSAVVSCYCITLAVLAERKRLPLERVEVTTEGMVERQLGGTLRYVAIRLQPELYAAGADEAQVRSLTEAAHKAEQYCLVSNAIRGNVEVTVEPRVITGT